MKSRYSNLNRWMVAIPVAALAVSLNAKAALVTTDTASFLAEATGGTFFYNFNDLTQNGTASSISKSGGGFSYTITSSIGGNGLYNLGDPRGAGISLIPADLGGAIVITFTSGNVSAVGAEFFLTDAAGALDVGSVSMTLSDSTVESYVYGGGEPVPFRGFTTDGALITSLTFQFTGSGTFYPTMDNLYVGAVPEGPAWLGAAFIGMVVGGRMLGRRRQSSRAA